jgi:hypothetical protein
MQLKKSFKESNIDMVCRPSKQHLQGSYQKLLRTCINLRLRELLSRTLVDILGVGSYFIFSINNCNFFVLRVESYFLKTLQYPKITMDNYVYITKNRCKHRCMI